MTLDRRELFADVAVHALGLALGAAGVVAMLVLAARSPVHGQLLPVTVYLAGLLAMLGCSAVYHVWRSCRWRDWLRRLDHAAIFVMIAGTYTPLVLLLVGGVVYSAGVVFHLAAHWRYARALWHGSVVIAAAIHYAAIMTLLQT